MGKYQNILYKKKQEEAKEEKIQEKLRKESGIQNKNVILRERSKKSYIKTVLLSIGYILYTILAFIGVLVLLYPESRNVFIGLFTNWF